MEVIDPGHWYLLHALDASGEPLPNLKFVKRIGPKYPGNFGAPHGGTTIQEVLRAVVDRLDYVGRQIPCWQTTTALALGVVMIWLLERRAAKRHGRQAPKLRSVVHGSFCSKCGHVGCRGECHE